MTESCADTMVLLQLLVSCCKRYRRASSVLMLCDLFQLKSLCTTSCPTFIKVYARGNASANLIISIDWKFMFFLSMWCRFWCCVLGWLCTGRCSRYTPTSVLQRSCCCPPREPNTPSLRNIPKIIILRPLLFKVYALIQGYWALWAYDRSMQRDVFEQNQS